MTLEPSGMTVGINDSFSVIFDRTFFIATVGSVMAAAAMEDVEAAVVDDVTIVFASSEKYGTYILHHPIEKCAAASW